MKIITETILLTREYVTLDNPPNGEANVSILNGEVWEIPNSETFIKTVSAEVRDMLPKEKVDPVITRMIGEMNFVEEEEESPLDCLIEG